jgi:cell division protein YceG involved in septum cleavage
LQAALNPAETDYLYYVREPARDDGAHNFYNNPADFERGVQALRNWERLRDARDVANGNSTTQ